MLTLFVILIVASGATLALLTAGYLFGVRKDRQARRELHELNRAFAREVARLRDQTHHPRGDDDGLRTALQGLLTPLVERERLSLDMSRLDPSHGTQRNLTAVLDQMAEKGNFTSVLLSDAQGWRIGASSATQDLEKLGATASLLLLIADRISRDGSPKPLSLMFLDAAGATTLCRVFFVGNQRMTLTVVADGAHLLPSAIDPALARLTAMLLNKEPA